MKDYRNWCSKLLSAECPNNCHYTTWCKYREEMEQLVSATKKKCIKCGSIMFSSQEVCSSCREKEHVLKTYGCFKPEPLPSHFIRCPKCNSGNIFSRGCAISWVDFDVNHNEITHVFETEPPEEIESCFCKECCHEWRAEK